MLDSIMNYAHLTSKAYYNLFSESKDEKKLGEASVNYLYHYDEVIPRVKKELGDIDIIIVLRNPVERAFSNFKYQSIVQYKSFEESLKLENKRKWI